METSTTHPMLLANNDRNRLETSVWFHLAMAALLLLQIATAGAQTATPSQLDLTAAPQREQQGLGFPGAKGGGGASQGPNRYDMPLKIQIEDATALNSGDFEILISMKNVGQVDLELPVSRNISDVQRTTGTFRRELLFKVRSAVSNNNQPSIVAVTAGSRQVAHSLIRLGPQQEIRVRLRVESSWARSSLPKNAKEVPVRIVCSGWALEDEAFAIQALSEEVPSENTATLGFAIGLSKAAVAGP